MTEHELDLATSALEAIENSIKELMSILGIRRPNKYPEIADKLEVLKKAASFWRKRLGVVEACLIDKIALETEVNKEISKEYTRQANIARRMVRENKGLRIALRQYMQQQRATCAEYYSIVKLENAEALGDGTRGLNRLLPTCSFGYRYVLYGEKAEKGDQYYRWSDSVWAAFDEQTTQGDYGHRLILQRKV